jgi:hypothetical protein
MKIGAMSTRRNSSAGSSADGIRSARPTARQALWDLQCPFGTKPALKPVHKIGSTPYPTFEDEDEREDGKGLKLCFIRVAQDAREEELAGLVIRNRE